jgi:spore maturation protein CgeB
MRISFFGSSLVSAYWNGAATYYRGIIRALYERGHRVTFYEPDAFQRQQHRDIPDPRWARVVVYPATQQAALRHVETAAKDDVLIKASGVGVLDEVLEAAIASAKSGANLTVFWDVDAPATLDRLQHNPSDRLAALIPRFDVVFTYGGGDPVVRAYRHHGAQRCVPIYNALDPQTHFPVPRATRFEAALSFLGNRLPDREKRADHFFFGPAAQLPEMKFLLGGAGWADKPLTRNIRYLDHVYTNDHNAFNCSPKAVLNISRESMARYGFSPATRVFEAAGAAACLITDYWQGIEMFLEPDHEVLVARNASEVVRHLRRLTPTRALAIGSAAYRRVLSTHTYAHRAAAVEAVLTGKALYGAAS